MKSEEWDWYKFLALAAPLITLLTTVAKWFKHLFRKVSKPYYLRYKYDDDKGFYLDENSCPLCSKCLSAEKSTPGKYLGNGKMLCPVHGEVDGAESVIDTRIGTVNINEETADEVIIKRKWINPKGEGIRPISAESTEAFKGASHGGGVPAPKEDDCRGGVCPDLEHDPHVMPYIPHGKLANRISDNDYDDNRISRD